MAEKNIGIRIQLNGMDTVVQDIETFERLLKEANEDLKQIPVGSENYKQLAKEIGKAKGQLNDLNKATEGLSSEKIAEGFGKLAGGITSSFAAATAAVSLFGNESETVQKAATEAQNLLTLALSIRGIMEVRTGAQIVARTVAEQASTAATNASNTATKALYTTLAANPYTAIIAAVGLLVGAYAAFRTSVDEAEIAQKKFYDTVSEDAAKTLANYESLTAIVNDSSISLDRRKKALENLKQSFPGYFKNLKDEEILNGKVKVEIDNVREAIVARALASAYEQKLTEKLKATTEERLKLAEREVKVQKLRGDATKEIERIENDATITGERFTRAIQQQSNLINQAASEEVGIAKERERLNKIDQQQIDIITAAIRAQTQVYGDLFDAKDENIKKDKDLTKENQKLIETYKMRFDLEVKLISNLNRLNEADAEVQQDILERAKTLLDNANELLQQRAQFFINETEIFTKELRDLLFTVVPSAKDLQSIEDAYLIGFGFISSAIKQGTIKLLDENGKAFQFSIETIKKLIKESDYPEEIKKSFDKLTDEQEKALIQFFQRFSRTAEEYSKEFKFGEIIFKPGDEKTIQENLLKLIQETKRILQDPTILPGEKDIKIREIIQSIFKFDKKVLSDFKDEIDSAGNVIEGTGVIAFQKYNEAIDEVIKNLTEFGKVEGQQLTDTSALAEELFKITLEIIKVGNALGNLNELDVIPSTEKFRLTTEQISIFIDKLNAKLKENPKLLEAFFKDISLNTEQYLARFGQEGLMTVFMGIQSGLSNIKDMSRKELEELLQLLVNAQGTIKTEFGDKVAASFEDLIKKITAQLKKLPTEAKTATQETLDEITKVLQIFNQLVGKFASTVATEYQLKLQIATKQYQDDLKDVTGETKRANEIRLELEQQFQRQKAEIEKRAAIRALQFQLAQAIADGAQAVIANAANPVLAAIIAGITLYQLDVIRRQIQFTQSLAGGGRIRMGAGGMVVGPSHEMGGVSYPMGVNLEGGETVINRTSSLAYGDLLSSVNQMGGGQPIISNATNTLMEERLIQAIAKTRSTPIRAYVLEQDITRSQTIQRKLDQLATL